MQLRRNALAPSQATQRCLSSTNWYSHLHRFLDSADLSHSLQRLLANPPYRYLKNVQCWKLGTAVYSLYTALVPDQTKGKPMLLQKGEQKEPMLPQCCSQAHFASAPTGWSKIAYIQDNLAAIASCDGLQGLLPNTRPLYDSLKVIAFCTINRQNSIKSQNQKT